MELPEKAQVRFRARYSETDQMGIVYHANYLAWFEMARTELCAVWAVLKWKTPPGWWGLPQSRFTG